MHEFHNTMPQSLSTASPIRIECASCICGVLSVYAFLRGSLRVLIGKLFLRVDQPELIGGCDNAALHNIVDDRRAWFHIDTWAKNSVQDLNGELMRRLVSVPYRSGDWKKADPTSPALLTDEF